MHDIYHLLCKCSPDFKNHSDEQLSLDIDLYAHGANAITNALTLIGNLSLDATFNEDYSDSDARRDLILLSSVLRDLPRMGQALNQCSNTASYVRSERNKGKRS